MTPLTRATHINTIKKENGNAAAIDAVCKVLNAPLPPAVSSTAAINPWITPQNTRWRVKGFSSPSLMIVVNTRVPESEDVMK